MRFSESWLREFVSPEISAVGLAEQLTMAGLEVSAVESAVPEYKNVVVGRLEKVDKHPEADRLSVCQVDVGTGELLQIVCGAPNVYEGMYAPTALVGGRLPGGIKIRKTKLRGVESQGMLCSARELELGDDSDGIMDLPKDGDPGREFGAYLAADDHVIEIELTPNRGDCLSLRGIAREVGAVTDLDVTYSPCKPVKPSIKDEFPVDVHTAVDCPVFAGRVIRGIDPAARTPIWMQERLRRGSIRPISPIVDVTNYVLLELGQPMHGYDLRQLSGRIIVRFANPGEKLVLLDGREVELQQDVLVIADEKRVLGLAGIMGGEATGISTDTTDIFLESAFFNPLTVAGRGRRYALHTDASQRFERGVDASNQAAAVERATELLLQIAGGQPGPVIVIQSESDLPVRHAVRLRRDRLRVFAGQDIPDGDVVRIFERLNMQVTQNIDGWEVTPPAPRFDINIEEDLIEEVLRIHGYDRIAPEDFLASQKMAPQPESRLGMERLREALVQRGYQEAITYSFVNPDLQQLLYPEQEGLALANPISEEMSEMRLSLWPGLIGALRHNYNRQQARIKLFEVGLRFIPQANEIKQEKCIAGIAMGPALPEQWGVETRQVDFADLRNDVEALLSLAGKAGQVVYDCVTDPALHPGQAARIMHAGEEIGRIGALHPVLLQKLDVKEAIYVFEIQVKALIGRNVPVFAPISRYPAIRRDLAVVVEENVPVGRLLDSVRASVADLLQQLKVFDIYRGKGIDSGRKSVALSLILQDSSRTLTDEAIEKIMSDIAARLRKDFDATIRE